MQVNALNTEPMVQADEQILENLEEAGLEASQEKVSLDATEHAEEETVSVGKASLGIAPQPKTFGQLSNKLFSLDEEEASNAEKSA